MSELNLLAERLRENRATLLLGGDLPAQIGGAPPRAELARGLAQRHDLAPGLTLAQAAQRVGVRNRFELLSYLRGQVESTGREPQPIHTLIARLPFQTIISTAYDRLLERAFDQAAQPLNVIARNQQGVFADTRQRTLIKLYGDLSDPETVIVTEDDQDGLLSNPAKADLVERVRAEFSRQTILFIGHNLQDHDFRMLWHEITSRMGKFAIQAYAIWPGMSADERRIWEERNIRVIDMQPVAVLEQLAAALAIPIDSGKSSAQPAADESRPVQTKQQMQPKPVDFVVITALTDERTALLRCLPGHQRVPAHASDIHTYYEASIPVQSAHGFAGCYRAIVCQLPGMGRVRAAAATKDFVLRWQPRYLVLVGIAGGIAAKGVACGDVLVATQIVDYELQKLTPDGVQMRWEVHSTDEWLANAGNHLSDEWKQAIGVERPGPGNPQVHHGPVASGDKVITFENVLQQHREHWPALIGVEMEAAGVAAANFQAPAALPFFMVRGVSDLADAAKSDSWRSYACAVAARYTVALLASGPVPTQS